MHHHIVKNIFQKVLPEFDFVIVHFKELLILRKLN